MLLPIWCAKSARSEQSAQVQTTNGETSRNYAFDNELLGDLLTVDEVARRLTLAPKTVRQLCLSRRLSAIRLQRSWRIPAAALDQFVRERLISSV
jgi:excisionase family DNA binding protein